MFDYSSNLIDYTTLSYAKHVAPGQIYLFVKEILYEINVGVGGDTGRLRSLFTYLPYLWVMIAKDK